MDRRIDTANVKSLQIFHFCPFPIPAMWQCKLKEVSFVFCSISFRCFLRLKICVLMRTAVAFTIATLFCLL